MAGHVRADLLREQRVRRDVGVGHRAHVHRAGADAVDERRSPLDVLVQHEPAQRLGVADQHGAGDAARAGRAHVRGRRVDERDEQLGAADDLGERVGVVHQRRRRHGVDAEALLLAADRRHLLHAREHGAVARRDEQRLARAPQHGDDLDEVVDRLRGVLGQAHAHDEVDVGQHLAERGHALDVGAADPAALAGLRVAHVEHVRAGAVVDLAVAQREWLGLAAARLEQPLPRRTRQRILDQSRAGCARGGRRPRRRRRGTAPAPARSARRRPCRPATRAWPRAGDGTRPRPRR